MGGMGRGPVRARIRTGFGIHANEKLGGADKAAYLLEFESMHVGDFPRKYKRRN